MREDTLHARRPDAPEPGGRDGAGHRDATDRLAREEARRVLLQARIRPNPERLAAGWERRFLADAARAREAQAIYEGMGFEVALDPVRPQDLEPDCADCALVTAAGFRMIYTRRRPR